MHGEVTEALTGKGTFEQDLKVETGAVEIGRGSLVLGRRRGQRRGRRTEGTAQQE